MSQSCFLKGLTLNILLLICIACYPNHANANLHSYVMENSDALYPPDFKHRKLLSAIFTRLGKSISPNQNVQINSPYKRDSINIYIIDLEDPFYKNKEKFAFEYNHLLSALNNNAIALPPDIIFIDYALVGELLANAAAELVMKLQSSPTHEALPKDIIKLDDLISTLADYHRYRNIRLVRGLTDSQDAYWIKEGFNNKSDYWRVMLDKIQLAGLGAYLAPSIAPIFYHEMGHLEQNTTGKLFDKAGEVIQDAEKLLSKLVTSIWNSKLKKIEDEADEYSNKQILRFLQWSKDNAVDDLRNLTEIKALFPRVFASRSSELDKLSNQMAAYLLIRLRYIDRGTIEKLTIAATAKYYRDLVIVNAFQNFRGIDAEDLVHKFYHKQCDGTPLEFNLYEDIERIHRGFLPILNSNDWENIRERFFNHVENETHTHNFYRASKLLQVIAKKENLNQALINNWRDGENLFKALFENKPSLIEPTFRQRTNIKTEELVSFLSKNLELTPAVSCKKFNCQVGYFKSILGRKDSSAYLEVVSDKQGYVVFARLAYKTTIVPREEWGKPENKDAMLEQIENLAISLRFIGNAVGEKVKSNSPQSPLLQSFIDFRMDIAQCLAASGFINTDHGVRIELRTLTRDRWVSIEIMPNQDAPKL